MCRDISANSSVQGGGWRSVPLHCWQCSAGSSFTPVQPQHSGGQKGEVIYPLRFQRMRTDKSPWMGDWEEGRITPPPDTPPWCCVQRQQRKSDFQAPNETKDISFNQIIPDTLKCDIIFLQDINLNWDLWILHRKKNVVPKTGDLIWASYI